MSSTHKMTVEDFLEEYAGTFSLRRRVNLFNAVLIGTVCALMAIVLPFAWLNGDQEAPIATAGFVGFSWLSYNFWKTDREIHTLTISKDGILISPTNISFKPADLLEAGLVPQIGRDKFKLAVRAHGFRLHFGTFYWVKNRVSIWVPKVNR